LSWGDGNHELTLWGHSDGGTEWSLNNDVSLETSLVLSANEWSFVGKAGVGFPCVNGVNFSNDLRVTGAIFLDNADCSTERQMDWESVGEGDWDTETRWEFSVVFSELEGLLVVEGDSVQELWEQVGLGASDELLDLLFVDGEDALHFVSDGELDGTFNFLFLLTLLEPQDLADLEEVWVSLLEVWFLLLDFIDEEVDKLLDSVSVSRDFEWAESMSSLTLADKVAVVHVLGDVGVFSAEILELVSEAGLEVLRESSGEGVAGLGVSWNNGLGKGKDGTGLADHWPKETVEWSFNMSQTVERSVDESVDFLGRSEPGGVSKLLPDGDVSIGGVEEERDGGHADRWEFTTVERNGNQNWENLLFDELVGQEILAVTVDGLDAFGWDIFSLTRLEESLEGEDGLSLDVWVDGFIEDLLDDWDNFWDTEVSESVQVDNDPVLVFWAASIQMLLNSLDKVLHKVALDELGISELTIDLNWVTRVPGSGVDVGLVQELGESEDGGGGNLLGVFNIDGIRVDQGHEFLGQLLSWSADVQWEGHEELSGFLSLDFLLLDQVEDELDGWVVSGHDESVQEDIAGGLLLLGLVLGGDLAVKSFVLAVWKTAEDAGNGGDLGDGFSLSKRLLGV
jgi:hypothetical protein